MRIDENDNIEIESEEDYKKGILSDYGFTCNPKQTIYTKDLVHCVGLGFIQEINGIRKRGLMHVFYNKEFARNENSNLVVRKDRLKETKRALEEFLAGFKENGRNKNAFTHPKAIMVYTRTFLVDRTAEKIILRDESTEEFNEREIEDKNRYENPMANYIRKWIEKNNIDLCVSEATTNKKMPSVLNMDDDPTEIHHKEFALTNDKIRIGMYNEEDILLNPKNYEAGLEF